MFSTFQTVSRIVYGCGMVSKLGDEVKKLGCKSVAIITDKGLIEANVHTVLLDALKASGIKAGVFDGVVLDPTIDAIEKGTEWVKKQKADILIGLGGGSAMDTTKAIAVLATHKGPINQYFGMHKVPSACMPTIMIPTTAGTGSEVTSVSVVTDSASQTKQGIVSDYIYAKTVLLDPELSITLNPYYTAITGLDAMVHGMESYVNVISTPFTDALNLSAIKMLAANIRQAYTNGQNLKAREQMLYGAAMSGMGFSQTQNGIIHAIGMSVDPAHHLPHGLLMAVCAPMGLTFNAPANPEKFAKIAEILGSAKEGDSLIDKAKSAAIGFANLMEDLGIEQGLGKLGIKRQELKGIAERAAAYRRLMDGNPRKATAEEILKLLEKFF